MGRRQNILSPLESFEAPVGGHECAAHLGSPVPHSESAMVLRREQLVVVEASARRTQWLRLTCVLAVAYGCGRSHAGDSSANGGSAHAGIEGGGAQSRAGSAGSGGAPAGGGAGQSVGGTRAGGLLAVQLHYPAI